MAERSAVKREQEEFSKKTVLIVDDEAGMRTLLRAMVEGASVPCRIVEAADGDSAVEMARRDRPDVVPLDIVLPGSSASGVPVCQELCKDSRTKVVIVHIITGTAIMTAARTMARCKTGV